jgi:hypothetical protein
MTKNTNATMAMELQQEALLPVRQATSSEAALRQKLDQLLDRVANLELTVARLCRIKQANRDGFELEVAHQRKELGLT